MCVLLFIFYMNVHTLHVALQYIHQDYHDIKKSKSKIGGKWCSRSHSPQPPFNDHIMFVWRWKTTTDCPTSTCTCTKICRMIYWNHILVPLQWLHHCCSSSNKNRLCHLFVFSPYRWLHFLDCSHLQFVAPDSLVRSRPWDCSHFRASVLLTQDHFLLLVVFLHLFPINNDAP